jgi:hypothetical protein
LRKPIFEIGQWIEDFSLLGLPFLDILFGKEEPEAFKHTRFLLLESQCDETG